MPPLLIYEWLVTTDSYWWVSPFKAFGSGNDAFGTLNVVLSCSFRLHC